MQSVDRGKNVASGLLLVVIGSWFAFSGRHLDVSSASNMGPGYFPMMLSGLLVALGVLVVAAGWRSPRDSSSPSTIGPFLWRGILLLTAALLFFAWLVKPLGLGPALAGTVAICCFASQRWRLVPTLILTVSMVLCGWGVFIRILQIPIPFLGPWLR